MTPNLTLGTVASAVVGAPTKRLFTWGTAFLGRLGNGTTSPDVTAPAQIGSDTDWDYISAGQAHNLAIRGGKLYAWGYNNRGQLGDGTQTNRNSPVQIGSDTDWAVVACAGGPVSFAIKENGKLYGWGASNYAANGLGTDDSSQQVLTPTQIGSDTDWSSVGAGQFHGFAIKTNGKLYGWGRNDNGRLGDGTTTTRTSPVQIGSDTDWAEVHGADAHSVALKTNGKLYTWGAASFGRLGNGTTSPDVTAPAQVGSDTDWDSLFRGNEGLRNWAIKTNGKLYGWGSAGGVGDGTTTQRESPVQIGSETDWLTGGYGSAHRLGIRSPGDLYSWGSNANGQTGLGTTSGSTLSPTRVGSDSDWKQVAPAQGHSAATR